MNASVPDSAPHDTPFAGLTPAVVLDALDSVGLRGDGRLLQLNSYENRVFQVYLEDGTIVVAKFYRPGRWNDAQILEEHGFGLELAGEDIPVMPPMGLAINDASPFTVSLAGNPPTLAQVHLGEATHRFSVTPFQSGRAPSLESDVDLEWIGRFIGRIHAVGARRPFQARKTFSVAEFGDASRDRLLQQQIIPPHAVAAWRAAADEALAIAKQTFERVGHIDPIRLHGDCHIGNLLWTDAGPHFVDLDDALNGLPIQDLWMLLPSEAAASRQHLHALLAGYELFHEFDDRQTVLIEALRTVRMIHYSAWIAQRWNDPAFPVAFAWFGEAAYWQQQAQDLREQCSRMTQR